MTHRERFLACLRFQPVDRVFDMEFGYWDQTLFEWRSQGLRPDVTDNRRADIFFGFDPKLKIPVNCGIMPAFERQILEETAEFRIVRDGSGVVRRELKNSTSMPEFIEFPVRDRESWNAMRERLDPDDPARYPDNWDELVRHYRNRDYPLGIAVSGFFGQLRNFIGLVNLSYMYYDDPELIADIQEHWTEFAIKVWTRALDEVAVDFADVWDDMAYRGGSLISPGLFRRFYTPYSRRFAGFCRERGVEFLIVDCDGNINDLAALYLEAGINVMFPLEAAAGTDPFLLRQRHGESMPLMGGVDKRALARGREAIDAELESKLRLLARGGYIPSVDHRVPPDVSYEDYLYYLQRKRELINDPATYGRGRSPAGAGTKQAKPEEEMGYAALDKAEQYMKTYPESLLEAGGGKPLAGVFCSNAPEELIHAAGALPIRVMPSPVSAAGSQSELQAFACAVVRSYLVEGLAGKLGHLDGFVFTCACDSLKALLCLWEKHFPDKLVHNFNLPLNMATCGVGDFYMKELERLNAALAGLPGAKAATAESLAASIAAYNENRALFAKLREYTRGGALRSSDFMKLLWARLRMPVELSAELVRELLAELETAEDNPLRGEPVLLWGSFIPDLTVFEAVEELGAVIADDNFCAGGRYLDGTVPDDPDPFGALFKRFMARRPCPTLHPGYSKDAIEVLGKLIRLSGAKGVIFLFQKFCEPYAFDYPLYADALEKLGVSHLLIELEEGAEGLSGQAGTRIEAFLETIQE